MKQRLFYPKVFSFGFPALFFMIEFMVVVWVHGLNGAFYPIINFIVASLLIFVALYFFHYQPMVKKNEQLTRVKEELEGHVANLRHVTEERDKLKNQRLKLCFFCRTIKENESDVEGISPIDYITERSQLNVDRIVCDVCSNKHKYRQDD